MVTQYSILTYSRTRYTQPRISHVPWARQRSRLIGPISQDELINLDEKEHTNMRPLSHPCQRTYQSLARPDLIARRQLIRSTRWRCSTTASQARFREPTDQRPRKNLCPRCQPITNHSATWLEIALTNKHQRRRGNNRTAANDLVSFSPTPSTRGSTKGER